VGQYIENIVYISPISIPLSYRHFRYGFFDISISYRWQVEYW